MWNNLGSLPQRLRAHPAPVSGAPPRVDDDAESVALSATQPCQCPPRASPAQLDTYAPVPFSMISRCIALLWSASSTLPSRACVSLHPTLPRLLVWLPSPPVPLSNVAVNTPYLIFSIRYPHAHRRKQALSPCRTLGLARAGRAVIGILRH